MKKTAWLALLVLAAALSGCGAKPPVEAPTATTETAAEATTETAPQAAQTPQDPEGDLFLKVSSITFSLTGEREDIYLGTVPREEVTWTSDDPGVIDVSEGVLTALGVGTTTVHATWGDRQVHCTAGCLAQSQEELEGLDPEILASPKRLPPEIDMEGPCDYFDHAAIMGDSITYFLWQYENTHHELGSMTFVSRHGISIHSLVNRSKNMYFEGQEMNIEDIVDRLDVSRIYILLGCLDFQVPASTQTLREHWEQLLDLISQKSPEKELVLISNIPSYTDKQEWNPFNRNVAEFTPQLRLLAAERGCGFLDLGYYIQDHYGRMPKCYQKDEFHMNDAGSHVWSQLLRYYAQFEREGGTLAVLPEETEREIDKN